MKIYKIRSIILLWKSGNQLSLLHVSYFSFLMLPKIASKVGRLAGSRLQHFLTMRSISAGVPFGMSITLFSMIDWRASTLDIPAYGSAPSAYVSQTSTPKLHTSVLGE